MAFLIPLGEAVAELAGVLGEAAAEGAAVGAEAAEAAAAAAAETAAAEAAAAAAAETAAAEAAAAATAETAAAEVAAAEAAATAEAVTVESEAGLETTIRTGEEAVEAAEKAAELKAGLGARISKAVGGKIVQGLKGSLNLLKKLSSKAGDAILLKTAIDQVPAEQRKGLAGNAMMLAAMGNKLAIVAYAYMAITGGSDEGKKVAKQAQDVAKGLNEKARNLQVDTPSKLPIDKETHEAEMKKINQQAESDKQHLDKITGMLDEMDQLMKEHEGDKPIVE